LDQFFNLLININDEYGQLLLFHHWRWWVGQWKRLDKVCVLFSFLKGKKWSTTWNI